MFFVKIFFLGTKTASVKRFYSFSSTSKKMPADFCQPIFVKIWQFLYYEYIKALSKLNKNWLTNIGWHFLGSRWKWMKPFYTTSSCTKKKYFDEKHRLAPIEIPLKYLLNIAQKNENMNIFSLKTEQMLADKNRLAFFWKSMKMNKTFFHYQFMCKEKNFWRKAPAGTHISTLNWI